MRNTFSSRILFALFALCGFAISGAAQDKAPPPPGKLVDIGGYRLLLNCNTGNAPTVVLIAGSGDFSFTWGLAQPAVAKFTRVCSYDFAFWAWSDPGPLPRTMKQDAYELHNANYILATSFAAPPVIANECQ